MMRFIGHFVALRDYILQFTITHTLMSTVMSSPPLLGSRFQWQMFLFFGFLNCPRPQLPASKSNISQDWTAVKFKIMLWLTVMQPFCLDVKHPSGAEDQIFVTGRQLHVCWCGAPSPTRGWVCHLQLLLALASMIILGSESRGTLHHILLSQTPPTYGTRMPYLYPPSTGWPSYTPRHWIPFSWPPTTCRVMVEIFGAVLVLHIASRQGL
jgi:hypothetical protein